MAASSWKVRRDLFKMALFRANLRVPNGAARVPAAALSSEARGRTSWPACNSQTTRPQKPINRGRAMTRNFLRGAVCVVFWFGAMNAGGQQKEDSLGDKVARE